MTFSGVKLFASKHQWLELLSWVFLNRLKIPLNLFNFHLLVLGFNLCQGHCLPLNSDVVAGSRKCLTHSLEKPSQICHSSSLGCFSDLAHYCHLIRVLCCSTCPSFRYLFQQQFSVLGNHFTLTLSS